MAEIVFTKPRDVEIPVMEAFNQSVRTKEALPLASLVKGDAGGVAKNPVNNPHPSGVALHPADRAGAWISLGKMGELSGFDTTGIVPFDLVYPSAAVPGGMATGAQAQPGAQPIGSVTADGQRIQYFCK